MNLTLLPMFDGRLLALQVFEWLAPNGSAQHTEASRITKPGRKRARPTEPDSCHKTEGPFLIQHFGSISCLWARFVRS